MGPVYFHYRKIVGGQIINTTLTSSFGLLGLFPIMPGSCGKQHKVGIELMCHFVENLSIFLKKKSMLRWIESAQKNCSVMPKSTWLALFNCWFQVYRWSVMEPPSFLEKWWWWGGGLALLITCIFYH